MVAATVGPGHPVVYGVGICPAVPTRVVITPEDAQSYLAPRPGTTPPPQLAGHQPSVLSMTTPVGCESVCAFTTVPMGSTGSVVGVVHADSAMTMAPMSAMIAAICSAVSCVHPIICDRPIT